MDTKKGLIVAFFGKPNVGKSTLFNALQKNVYAIVSHKPQTTRDYITARMEIEDGIIVLLDTPGFHNPNNKLDMFLNSQIKYALKLSDMACYICDPTKNLNDEDITILTYLKNLNDKKRVLIINKIDLVTEDEIKIKKNEINKILSFDHTINISALNNIGINELKKYFEQNVKESDVDFNFFKEPNDEFITKEIIREVCLINLQKEVPYGISIMINEFKYDKEKNFLNIIADIYVEKESQKGIVVGKLGSMIKKIGTDSRTKLLEIYDCKINLSLYVKVKSDWRQNNDLVKLMGYKKKC